MATRVNLEFPINPQALAVLAAVKQYAEQPCFDGLDVQAWPHFNGRERGICLEIGLPLVYSGRLLISFGEVRNSDELFVQHTTTERIMLNGPSLDDFDEQSYRTRSHFGELDVVRALHHIMMLTKSWRLTREATASS